MSIVKESDQKLYSQNPEGWSAAMRGSTDDCALQKMLDNGYSARELNYLPDGPPAPLKLVADQPDSLPVSRPSPRRKVKVAA